MALTRVLTRGHSNYSPALLNNFHLGDVLVSRWQGIGRRTVPKTIYLIKYDLGMVESFTAETNFTTTLNSLFAVGTG